MRASAKAGGIGFGSTPPLGFRVNSSGQAGYAKEHCKVLFLWLLPAMSLLKGLGVHVSGVRDEGFPGGTPTPHFRGKYSKIYAYGNGCHKFLLLLGLEPNFRFHGMAPDTAPISGMNSHCALSAGN
jgi:hypothetical protein